MQNACVVCLSNNIRNLRKTLPLLVKNFLVAHPYKFVLLCEPKDFTKSQRAAISNLYDRVEFRDIDLSAPPVKTPRSQWLYYPQFSVGYRSMCRLFAMRLWDIFSSYDFVMRVDDDSYVRSEIKYDPFDRLLRDDLVYAYRGMSIDKLKTQPGLSQLLCVPFTPYIIYTNFFVTRTDWWRSEVVQEDLRLLDKSESIYVHRWGDAPIHTYLLKKYGAKIAQWHDFSYSHNRRSWETGNIKPDILARRP